MSRSLVTSLVLSLLWSWAFLVPAPAYALGISPGHVEIAVPAGGERLLEFTVMNDSGTVIKLHTYVRDWSMRPDGTIIKGAVHSEPSWLSIEGEGVEIEPQAKVRVPCRATVPPDVRGELRAMVFFEGSSISANKGPATLVMRIGSAVYAGVKGTSHIGGTLNSFEMTKVPKDDASAEYLDITAEFKNTGNIHLRPSITVRLQDRNGSWVRNDGGEIIKISVTQTAPVLPGNERIFRKKWQGTLESGEYVAVVSIALANVYGGEPTIREEHRFPFEIRADDGIVR